MRCHMKKCIRKAAAAVLSAALLVTSESPAFAQNIQQTAVPADVITEQSRLEDGIAQTGYISDSFSEKRQEVQKEDTEGLLKSAAEQLPGQYRTQQLPAVRNQGGYGTCWAFSTIACMEINLMKKGYGETDLSELQLIYFATHSVKDKLGGLTGDDYVYTDTDINYLMRGGNYEMAVNTLSDWLSAAREESAPYETAADVLDTGLSDELAYADVAHLQNYRSYNLQNMEDVKQAVMDYGAVGISYYAYTYSGFASNQYYNADTAGYYCYDEQTTNHAVTVVGWDDDYPAQNFPTAPEGNGAWIVRNSWGSDFGEDGYFYISYYDQSLSGSAVAFEAEPADNYDNNYQYDGSAFAMMTGKQQFKAANVFTAKDVKQAVMDYGAVGISYYAYTYSGFASNQYYNADTAGYYCYDEQTTNHAVTVVGWDDDYPAQNFPTAPEGNGAWIVRNSWGSDFGEDGYFYISYYDQSLSGSAVAFEAEPADNYDNNYQYDGSAFAMMTGKQQFKAANVFTAKANENGTEQIAAASFEVMAKQMDYTVSIYTGLTDVDNPESGELKAQKSGSFSSGDKDNLLKTVAFDEPVTVNQGEIFSVVAAFAGSGGQSVMLYYDCARTLNGIQANCAAQPHQSYIYLNEYYGWSDYGNTNNTNFRIKAFTNNVAEPDTAVTAVKLNKHALELNWQQSEQLMAEVLPENAANKNVIWTSSDSGVAEVSQEGVVTAKGAGSAVITVETEDGKMQDSCTVTVKKPITDIKITGTGELKAGDKAALSVVILPQDTTDDTTVVWTSSDTNIAAVDQNGLVTALSKGTVTITAKAGTHTAEHTLVITQAAPKPTESTTEATTEVTKPTQKPTESTTEATTEAPKPTPKPTESTTEATTEAPKPTPKPTESTTEAPKPTQKPTEATTEATKPTESTTEVTKPSEQPTETPTQKPDTEPTKPDTEEKVVYEMRQDAEGVWHYYANDVIAADYCGMACNEYGWWYIQNGDVNFTYTGMACNEYGWWYFNNGQLDLTFYGLANNEYGTWFYTNGQLNFGFTGMLIPDDRWLYVRNGQVLTDYTGMAVNEYGWWYFKDGQLDFNYTGMACNEYGWWYFNNGQLNLTFNGLADNEYGTWFYTNGQLNFGFTGMLIPDDRWLYVRNGQVLTDYTGMAVNDYGWWYFKDGAIDFVYTGMAVNEYGWWYFNNGVIDFAYTGIGSNEYGQWYFNRGTIDFGYSGTFFADGRQYTIRNGLVIS